MNKKDKSTEDFYLPSQYLNNENPYAFRFNYDQNIANLQMNKEKLNTLHRLQPQKLNITFDHASLDKERKHMIAEAIKIKREKLIKKGFEIIGKEPVDDETTENILETYIDDEKVLDILLDLKRMNLLYQQMKLRARVSQVISSKVDEVPRIETKSNDKVVVDNLREAFIYSSLHKYYENRGKDKNNESNQK